MAEIWEFHPGSIHRVDGDHAIVNSTNSPIYQSKRTSGRLERTQTFEKKDRKHPFSIFQITSLLLKGLHFRPTPQPSQNKPSESPPGRAYLPRDPLQTERGGESPVRNDPPPMGFIRKVGSLSYYLQGFYSHYLQGWCFFPHLKCITPCWIMGETSNLNWWVTAGVLKHQQYHGTWNLYPDMEDCDPIIQPYQSWFPLFIAMQTRISNWVWLSPTIRNQQDFRTTLG